jgi:hypothetical protein
MATSPGIRPGTQHRVPVPSRTYLEGPADSAQPLVRPAPRSVMYLPIVLLVAILPGLYALRNWDLNPPGPWWGLRGLAVLEGRVLDQTTMRGLPAGLEEKTYRAVALQPPLYAWLEAIGLWFSGDRAPLATVLPSYMAGAFVVLLAFLLGKLWRGPGVGVVAAVLTGFNHSLLVQMQQATPATLGLAGALASVYGYAQFLVANDCRRFRWVVFGGTGLGLSLLSVGTLGLAVIPTILLHRASLVRMSRLPRRIRPKKWWREHAELVAGAVALLIALLIAGPWHLMMFRAHGTAFVAALLAPPQSNGPGGDLLSRLVELAPATLPLGLYGAYRALKRCLKTDEEDRETVAGALCLAWLAIAAITPLVLAKGPRPALNLWLLIPLNLFAAATIADLANRFVAAKALCWLAPASVVTISWWTSSHIRVATSDLLALRSPDSNSALGMHMTIALVIVTLAAVRGLEFWSRKRDDRQLRVLACCLGSVLMVTIAAGLREVQFRHRETSELLALRESILRRQMIKPFTTLAVVGPVPGSDVPGSRPGGRLRFLLRATLPELAQMDLQSVEDLRKLPGNQKLVILAGNQARLDYATQSRLGLEAIYPGRSGELEAFATRTDGNRSKRP